MFYLILSIAASTGVLLLFKQMQLNNVDTRRTIMLSYLAPATLGMLVFRPALSIVDAFWFWPAALEGAGFYIAFRLIAKTAQTNGVAVAGVTTKMSVVIPILVGVLFLKESTNPLILAGVTVGLASVVFSASGSLQARDWKWPILAFFASGAIDASLKLFQVYGLSEAEFPAFIATIFAFAFIAGLGHHLMHNERAITTAIARYSLVLGVINFATVYFLLTALATLSWPSSVIFPINNMGVVALSTLAALILFKEKLSSRGWLGFGLAIAAIALLYLGTNQSSTV